MFTVPAGFSFAVVKGIGYKASGPFPNCYVDCSWRIEINGSSLMGYTFQMGLATEALFDYVYMTPEVYFTVMVSSVCTVAITNTNLLTDYIYKFRMRGWYE
jgi:hypothetical protein